MKKNHIEERIALIKPLLPQGWCACEGCAFYLDSLTLGASHVHISANVPKSADPTRRTMTKEERAAWRKAIQPVMQEIAVKVKQAIPTAKIQMEGATIYVK